MHLDLWLDTMFSGRKKPLRKFSAYVNNSKTRKSPRIESIIATYAKFCLTIYIMRLYRMFLSH